MGRLISLVLIAAMLAGCSRSGSAPAAHDTPATVDHPRTEAELSTVKLTPEAVKRLGIETVTVKTEAAAATRTLGGEIVVPEGRGVVVTAPVAGTLTGTAPPRPGQRVRRGERLMTIAPLMATERDQRIEAQRAVTAAEAEELAARQRLQRLEQLLKDGAASVRSVEEARAQHQVTVAASTAARERLAGASKNPVGAQGELIVSAPFDGVVQAISAVAGQTVAASAPLLQLAQIDTLWVRVPIYAGDARAVDEGQRATVRRLGETSAPLSATRVTAPLQGDPSAASVDLYYALASSGATLRPGERVLVELPLTSTEQGLVVPDTAVLYDIHGATWVYEDLGGNAYTRRRIEVARHAGDRAVVRRGLSEGVKVVTAGAAELFGTEFGAGH
jgi:cobalt-zinc-cadmium efflux system membrane fusion protein